MIRALKFLLLVLLLNVVRYGIGGPIEGILIMEPMHAVMPLHPEVFDNEFSNVDFSISLAYNFVMWLTATWVFHLLHPVLRGGMILAA